MRTGLGGAVLASFFLISGCSSLTQVQDSLSKFDQGAHSVSTSQMSFLNGAHAVECATQFYGAAYAYSLDNAVPIDLRGQCKSDGLMLSSAQIQVRQNLMDSITLYADQLQALSSAGDDKNLDSNLQTTAGNLNTLAGKYGLSKQDASIAHDVEAAVVGLTNMVLDQKKANDVRAAASAQQANLSKVVTALKAENVSLASGIDGDIGDIRAHLAALLAVTRNKQGSAVFFDVVRARNYLQAVSPFGTQAMDDSVGAKNPTIDPLTAVQQLNAALDSLVSANNAIATSGTGGITAAVSDLVARAQAAQTFQAALGK
jgi:hypothetical protein